jgi:IMP cyclohydrolase
MAEEETILTLDELVAQKEYWGRFIAVGADSTGEKNVVVYFVTGRSPPSRARILLHDEETGTIYTEPTNKEAIEKGSPSLLIYPAIMETPNGGIAVSNGFQTQLVYSALRNYERMLGADGILERALSKSLWIFDKKKYGLIDVTSFEPDAPNNTPRISGAIERDTEGSHVPYSFALAISRKGEDGEADKEYWGFGNTERLEPGKAFAVATYTGTNVPTGEVLPSFEGEMIETKITQSTPKDIAEAVYGALGPKLGEGIISPGDDFRVGVAVVCQDIQTGKTEHYIINRHERGE